MRLLRFLGPLALGIALGVLAASWLAHREALGPGPTAKPEHEGHAMPGDAAGPQAVYIAPARQQLIGVRTGRVERDRLRMSVRAVGILEPDQTRLTRIQTRISGWVTRVHVNFVGQSVAKGDPLLDIYSPELLATQEEFLIALGGEQPTLAVSARRRLQLWQVPEEEIREIETTRKVRDTLTLRSPIAGRVLAREVFEGARVEPAHELYRIADLSVLWVQAKVYEYELPHVEVGQPVRMTLASEPTTEFEGRVSFVEPVLQEQTRTVRLRVAIDNAEGRFKPGMYADLWIDHDMGEGLLVPVSALLFTGERALAFRVVGEGMFEPVEVKAGAAFGERIHVLAGLAEGDRIVTSAVFLIDAESQLESATAKLGHQHGAAK